LFGAGYASAQAPAAGARADAPAGPESAAAFARQVSEFTLPNGLHFVIVERHDAPVVSFHTYVRAGGANVPAGQSGLVRLVERLAWSGTESIGSRDWAAEKKALDAVEEAYDRLQGERNKAPKADEVKITSLGFDLQRAIDRAQGFAKPGAYLEALTDQGATGVGVSVSSDAIQYLCTLPSNRAELWFSMESQRLARPVLRGFYGTRDQLAQQNRMPPPEVRVADLLLAAAFPAHPYRNPINGWVGDMDSLRTADLRSFQERYFVPGNLTIGIAGDLTPADARRLADRYFAGAAWSAKPLPAAIPTQDPVQIAPRTAIAYNTTQPVVAVGYRRPNQLDRDDAVFDAIQSILVGAKGWLTQGVVEEKGIATGVRVQATYPGGRYPALFTVVAHLAPGRTLDEATAAIQLAIDRLRNQPVDDATLARAKAHVRQTLLGALMQNASTAAVLAVSTAEYGDWREPFTELDRIDRLTAPEMQLTAAKYLAPERRTAVYCGPEMPPARGGAK
jgi:predicted Zn-dependent peptidase